MTTQEYISSINTEIKNAKALGHSVGAVSDGYHTFDELYEHRINLFITLCSMLQPFGDIPIWMSKNHSDGSTYEGWFIMGIGIEKGKQISYHLPMSKWNICNRIAAELPSAPEWDGHKSEDVIKRLETLTVAINFFSKLSNHESTKPNSGPDEEVEKP